MKDYIGQTITIEYDSTKDEIGKISDSRYIEPIMDFERGVYRFDLYMGGKKVGFFDKQNKEVNASLTPGELDKILGNNALRKKPSHVKLKPPGESAPAG